MDAGFCGGRSKSLPCAVSTVVVEGREWNDKLSSVALEPKKDGGEKDKMARVAFATLSLRDGCGEPISKI